MSNIVSFKIQIEGSNEFKTVTFSADELGKALDAVRTNAKTLNSEMVNLGSVSQVIESVSNAISRLNGMMEGLSSAYTEQIEAETLLANAMRNTMDASDEEIQRIKDLTAAQQRLGVVGDEVQLGAAQELATYLTMSSSLETIIPVMNDMIAQQIRLGASAESATQIATMLGKVMNGQTKALSRYGYEFSAAQEYILQFGDESERAAVLVDVVGESVGGANAAVRESIGAWQAMKNSIGDAKETIGRFTYQLQPAVSTLAEVGQATLGIIQLKNAIQALIPAQALATTGSKLYSAGLRMLGISANSAAAGTTAARLAVAALYATITMGASLALTGLISLLSRLGQKGKEAAEAVDNTTDANKVFADSSMKTRLELAEEIVKLEGLIKSKQDASKAVADLNSRYGEIFGNHKTAAEWYDTLTAKSAAYAQQVGYEAQARVLAQQKAVAEIEKSNNEFRMRELAAKLDDPVKSYGTTKWKTNSQFKADAKEYEELLSKTNALNTQIIELQSSFDACIEKQSEATQELGTTVEYTTKASGATKTLADDIKDYRSSVERAVQVNQAFGKSAADDDVKLQAMKSGITSLINKYGAESTAIQDLISEYYALLRAREASLGTLKTDVKVPTSYKDQDGKIINSFLKVPETPILESEYSRALKLYQETKNKMLGADPATMEVLKTQLATLRELYHIPEENEASVKGSVNIFGSLADAMSSLNSIVDESAASWLRWGSSLLSVIGQALPKLAALFTANKAVATAEGAAAVASTPIAGPVMAIAAIASIGGAIGSFPKFANGALVYGPTFGLVGEYPSAPRNPEVIAPLDKLQNLIQPAGGQPGQVDFFIDGYMLHGLFRKIDRRYSRNG